MWRYALDDLKGWQNKKIRKPLLLKGARQVGKTYLLLHFGKICFPCVHHFDFYAQPELASFFEKEISPHVIVERLSLYSQRPIDLSRDLIIFDEIQECPRALASLKYFAEQAEHSFVAASGSLLGVGLSEELFPVGKVEMVSLFPMTFEEFLYALGEDRFEKQLCDIDFIKTMPVALHERMLQLFSSYCVTGGLPEAVKAFRNAVNQKVVAFEDARKIQRVLLDGYSNDIAKHAGKIKSVRIQAVLQSIPKQLAREVGGVKKFVFNDVLPSNSRYSYLEAPIQWLIKSGLVVKVPIVSRSEFPFLAYSDERRFKLYFFDTALLAALANLPVEVLYQQNYGSYKGYIAENMVLQTFAAAGIMPCCWQKNTAEIEFLIAHKDSIVPIEVKAGINTKAKSLRVFQSLYAPTKTVLFSTLPYSQKGNKYQVPLYLAGKLGIILDA